MFGAVRLRFCILLLSLFLTSLVQIRAVSAQQEPVSPVSERFYEKHEEPEEQSAQGRIREFYVDAVVQPDASVYVKETLNLGGMLHGRKSLDRVLPVKINRHGVDYELDLRLISARDSFGNVLSCDIVRSGRNIVLHVNLPEQWHRKAFDAIAPGEQSVIIEYFLNDAMNFEQGVPEFYWHVTGMDNRLEVERMVIRLYSPASIPISQVRISCIPSKLVARTTLLQPETRGSATGSAGYLLVETYPLQPGNSFRISAGFPAGSINTNALNAYLRLAADWWPTAILPFLVGFGIYSIWSYCGISGMVERQRASVWQDAEPTHLLGTILAYCPARLGTLVDESCDLEDVLATLVDLARRGYVILHLGPERPENRAIAFSRGPELLEGRMEALETYEKRLLEAIFNDQIDIHSKVSLNDCSSGILDAMPSIRDSVHESLVRDGLMLGDAAFVRSSYLWVSLAIASSGILLILANKGDMGIVPISLALIFAAAILAAVSGIMPLRTKAGADLAGKILAWRDLLERVSVYPGLGSMDEDELEKIFEAALPCAMVLRVSDNWSQSFELSGEPGCHAIASPIWLKMEDETCQEQESKTSRLALVTGLGFALREIELTLQGISAEKKALRSI